MPERHHKTRNQNYPESERRERDRDYRRDRRTESYREDRSTDYRYEDRTTNYREPDQEVYTPYESTKEEALYNLKYILTSRGLCQGAQFVVNLLIVICAGVPYSNKGRYQDIANLGGLYYYYYGGAQAFTVQEAAKVNELDDLFYKLKIPPYIYSMACGGALMVYALIMLALGVFRVPYHYPAVLLPEALLDAVISLGYIPAVAFYFIKVKETYSNPICKQREEMYMTKNIKGYECSLSGTDVAGGIFGVLGVFVFMLSAVFAVRAFRAVRQMKQQREAENDRF
ncbi:MARVEL domain-containing protein 3 [Tachysurus fulvidraco]|uniref:MARVEL domain-containing protein 3 n=1 Tax=Tachysurus fulvidraco TaxID=1234273 RepID=UPI000F515323|nr:MARVEL domain-containing protein 3 [Tachysurus fulvidraco]XP_027034264.1 MARVEL domain-containing protein 3 [Tachysurus fulvidraco]